MQGKRAIPIKTQAELAGLVGRDQAQVSRWLSDDRWVFGPAPWPRSKLPDILRWVADELRRGGGAEDPEPATADLRRKKLQAEIRRLLASAEREEIALDRERGKLVDAASVKQEWANIGNVVRNAFQNIPAQLVPLGLRHGMPPASSTAFQSEAQSMIDDALLVLSGAGENDE